jgi:hypothetical protein
MHSKVIAAHVGTPAFGRPYFAHGPSKKKAVGTPLRQNLGYYVLDETSKNAQQARRVGKWMDQRNPLL